MIRAPQAPHPRRCQGRDSSRPWRSSASASVCAEWSGTREVSGSFALRAALQLVDDGEAHLVRSVMRSDGRDEVYIKATKQPYPITDLGRQYGASHR